MARNVQFMIYISIKQNLNVHCEADNDVIHSRLLHSDRDPVPDVPAIYFVMPSEENIQRICQVSQRGNNYIVYKHLCTIKIRF